MKKIVKSMTLFTVALLSLPATVFSHVRYIATDEEVSTYGGPDTQAFLEPLTDPGYVATIVITLMVILGLYYFVSRSHRFQVWSQAMVARANSYEVFVPWVARLSLGIILIGAGSMGNFLSPVLTTGSLGSFVQILIGFFLMAGFLVGPATVVVLVLYVITLVRDPYLIGSLDILALALSLIIMDARRPGVDDLIGLRDYIKLPKLRTYLPFIVRSGVGVAMVYLAIFEKILNPNLSSFVVEATRLVDVIPVSAGMWTFSAGIIELTIGLFLVFGFKTRLMSVIAIVVLSLSFFYFGEEVSSHITLFGSLSAVFILGAGALSIDSWRKFARHQLD